MVRKSNLIGRLRHKIFIEQATETEDSYGGIVSTWSTLITCRAAVEPLMGREYFAALQVNAERNMKFRIRYSNLVATATTKMRVKYDGRYFDVQSIMNIEERDHTMILMTVEDV